MYPPPTVYWSPPVAAPVHRPPPALRRVGHPAPAPGPHRYAEWSGQQVGRAGGLTVRAVVHALGRATVLGVRVAATVLLWALSLVLIRGVNTRAVTRRLW